MQIGKPLTQETLDAMPKAESAFWEDFLTQARVELDAKTAEKVSRPYAPTADLAAKYRRAIGEFKGGAYCQIKQLEGLFDFRAGS